MSPLPAGLHLMRAPGDSQIQLRVAPFFARKLKRIFGYVAEITLSDGYGTDAPAQLQIATRIPWRYGPSQREVGLSWILVRVQAFVSKALFDAPARVVCLCPISISLCLSVFIGAHPRIKLGHCVSGFLRAY